MSQTLRLQGRVALVTGGGSGIGRAAALAFSRDGAKVVVAGRRETALQETVMMIRERGGDAWRCRPMCQTAHRSGILLPRRWRITGDWTPRLIMRVWKVLRQSVT